MKDVSQILKSLGFLESEIKTYLAALKLGPSNVVDLTKEAGLSRQAIYTAIDALTERGIMSSAVIGKKRFYAAERPDKLLAYAKRREADIKENIGDLEKAVPELELQAGGEKPIVRVFEGKEGLKAIIDDIRLTDTKEMEEVADLDAMYKVLTTEDLANMRMELSRSSAKVAGLYSGLPQGTEVRPDLLNRQLLPEKYAGFKSNISVYGDKVALVTFEGKMYSTIIESKLLARTVKMLLDLARQGLNK